MDLSNLSPEQQKNFLALMSQANQQSVDPSSLGMATTSPQAAPQIQQQDGDKMHPMDAIQQITKGLASPASSDTPAPTQGPSEDLAAPSGVNLATGPKIQADKDGRLVIALPADHPLLRALGVKTKFPVNEPNYYDAVKQAGLDKFLPKGLAQMPDGTPFVGPESFKRALDAQKTLVGQGKETYTSLDQLTSLGLPIEDARQIMASNPKGVTSKEISIYQGSGRMRTANQVADAKTLMANTSAINQQLQVGGYDSLKPAQELAGKNLGSADKAQAIIDQIVANGGKATQQQRADLAAAIGVLSANSSGVLTNERMDQFLPQSLKGKGMNFLQYLTNEAQPVDFTGFLPQFQDLLSRERKVNEGIFNHVSGLGLSIYGQSNPNTAKKLTEIRDQNPFINSGSPSAPAPTAPKKVKTASDYLSKFGSK